MDPLPGVLRGTPQTSEGDDDVESLVLSCTRVASEAARPVGGRGGSGNLASILGRPSPAPHPLRPESSCNSTDGADDGGPDLLISSTVLLSPAIAELRPFDHHPSPLSFGLPSAPSVETPLLSQGRAARGWGMSPSPPPPLPAATPPPGGSSGSRATHAALEGLSAAGQHPSHPVNRGGSVRSSSLLLGSSHRARLLGSGGANPLLGVGVGGGGGGGGGGDTAAPSPPRRAKRAVPPPLQLGAPAPTPLRRPAEATSPSSSSSLLCDGSDNRMLTASIRSPVAPPLGIGGVSGSFSGTLISSPLLARPSPAAWSLPGVDAVQRGGVEVGGGGAMFQPAVRCVSFDSEVSSEVCGEGAAPPSQRQRRRRGSTFNKTPTSPGKEGAKARRLRRRRSSAKPEEGSGRDFHLTPLSSHFGMGCGLFVETPGDSHRWGDSDAPHPRHPTESLWGRRRASLAAEEGMPDLPPQLATPKCSSKRRLRGESYLKANDSDNKGWGSHGEEEEEEEEEEEWETSGADGDSEGDFSDGGSSKTSGSVFNAGGGSDRHSGMGSSATSDSENGGLEEEMGGPVCFQPVRRLARRVMLNRCTEWVFFALILGNCVTLSLEEPAKAGEKFFEICELFFTVSFLLEAVLKITAKGLYKGRHAYLRNNWNILDFAIVTANAVALFLFDTNVSAVRMLRAFKALLMFEKAPSLKRVITATIRSLRSLVHLALMLLFLVVIHSIWAVQLWKGTWSWRCVSGDDDGTNGQVCSLTNDSTFFASGNDCHDPWYTCVDYGNPYGGLMSFDNFGAAFLIVIQCVTVSGWSNIMYGTRDSNGLFPVFFFVNLVTLSSYCILPLCVVIIKDALHCLRTAQTSDEDHVQSLIRRVTEEAQASRRKSGGDGALELTRTLSLPTPHPSTHRLALMALRGLDFICPPLIGLNIAALMVRHNGQPELLTTVVEAIGFGTAIIFGCEVVLKISIFRRQYVKDGFNLIDLGTVILNVVEVLLGQILGIKGVEGLAALRAARLLRVIRALRSYPNLMRQAEGAISASKRFSYFILVFIFVFTSSLVFMHTCGDKVTEFSTLPMSILTSLQVITGDNWSVIMYTTMQQTAWPIAFLFVLCHLVGHFLFNKLFLAVVLDSYERVYNVISGTKGYGRRRRAERQQRLMLEEARALYTKSRYPGDWDEEFLVLGYRKSSSILGHHVGDEDPEQDGVGVACVRSAEPPRIYDALPVIKVAPDVFDNRESVVTEDRHNDSGSWLGGQWGVDEPATFVTHKMASVPREFSRTPNLSRAFLRGLVGLPLVNPSCRGHHAGDPAGKWSPRRGAGKRTPAELVSPTASPTRASYGKLHEAYDAGIQAREEVGPASVSCIMGWSATAAALTAIKPPALLRNDTPSFFIFPATVRAAVMEVVSSPYVEHAAVVLAIAQSVAAAMEHDSQALVALDYGITGFFAVEALAKSIACGMFFGKGAYLQDGWNVFEFLILTIVAASYVLKPLSKIAFVKILRAFRGLRPLRLLKRLSSVRSIAVGLIRIIPGIVTISILAGIVYVVFAIIGVDLLGGQLYKCSVPDIRLESDCHGVHSVDIESLPFSKQRPYHVPDELVLNYTGEGNKTAFLEAVWVNEVQHFDNVGAALRVLVTLSSMDNWRELLDAGMSSCGENQAMSATVGGCRSNVFIAVYLISFLFVVAFFVIPVVTSEVVVTYLHVRREIEHTSEYSARELSYFYLMKLLFLMKPGIYLRPRRGSDLAKRCYDYATHPYFDNLIGIAIVANIATMAMEHEGMHPSFSSTVQVMDYAFTVLFLLEAVMKIIAFGTSYFKPSWNRFDFLLVSASVLEMVLFVFLGSDSLPLNPFLLRSLRAFLRLRKAQRLLRLVRRTRGIQILFETVLASFHDLLANAFFFLVITVVYALLGVELFSAVKHGRGLTHHANFDTFLDACLVLHRVATGDRWNIVMENCMLSPPFCMEEEGHCGYPILAPLYFFSYKALTYVVMVSLFVATVMQTHNAMTKLNGLDGGMRDINLFMDTWSRMFSSRNTIPTRWLQSLLSEIGRVALERGDPIPPFGLPRFYTRDDLMGILRRYRFIDHKGDVSFARLLLEVSFHQVRSVGKGISREEWWSFEEDWERLVPGIRLPVTRWKWHRYTAREWFSALFIQQWYRFLKKSAKLHTTLAAESARILHCRSGDSRFSGPTPRRPNPASPIRPPKARQCRPGGKKGSGDHTWDREMRRLSSTASAEGGPITARFDPQRGTPSPPPPPHPPPPALCESGADSSTQSLLMRSCFKREQHPPPIPNKIRRRSAVEAALQEEALEEMCIPPPPGADAAAGAARSDPLGISARWSDGFAVSPRCPESPPLVGAGVGAGGGVQHLDVASSPESLPILYSPVLMSSRGAGSPGCARVGNESAGGGGGGTKPTARTAPRELRRRQRPPPPWRRRRIVPPRAPAVADAAGGFGGVLRPPAAGWSGGRVPPAEWGGEGCGCRLSSGSR